MAEWCGGLEKNEERFGEISRATANKRNRGACKRVKTETKGEWWLDVEWPGFRE